MSKAYNEMSYVEVAAIYNDINHIPLDAAADLGRAVAGIVGDGARIMDFGGGAGRISVPIAANTRMITMDIEHHMLKAAKDLAAQRDTPMQLATGTVLKTPFAKDTFDAIITTNVLHQIEQWREALLEAGRILKPGGIFVIGRDVLDEDSCAGRIRSQSRMLTGEIAPEMRPTDAAGPALFQFIEQQGWQMQRPVTACKWTEHVAPATILQRMENGTHNGAWSLSREQIDALMQRLRPWAESEFADLDREQAVQWEFALYPIQGLGVNAMSELPRALLVVRAIQLTLPRAAAGWLFALLTSNFNRIAIYELGITAALITTLLGLYHFLSPFEVVYGRLADRVPILGRHRSPYVFLGMMLSACAVALLPAIVLPMSQDPHSILGVAFPYASYSAGFLVLILFGIGFAMAGSNHLALVAEVIPERSRGLVTAMIWTMMIMGMILSLVFIRGYMPEYDHERMQTLYLMSIPVVGGLVLLGLLGVEPRAEHRIVAEPSADEKPHASLKEFAIACSRDAAVRNFFFYIFLFMFGYSLQNNIIEVFGAQVLGMTVGETGRFQQIWGSGAIVGMFAMGFMVFRSGMNKRTAITIGITGMGVALFLLAWGSLQASSMVVNSALVLMGFCNGLALVGTLTSMMEFSTDAERGAYIGIWGMSIAIASGCSSIASGHLVTGLIETGLMTPANGFAAIFTLEAFITLSSLWFLMQVKHRCFESAPTLPKQAAPEGALP